MRSAGNFDRCSIQLGSLRSPGRPPRPATSPPLAPTTMAAVASSRAAELLRPAGHPGRGLFAASRPAAPAQRGGSSSSAEATALPPPPPAPRRQRRNPHQLLCSSTSSRAEPAASQAVNPAAEVKAVLFDMDGVLTNSEEVSRQAACEVMAELYGLSVDPDEFIPFTGTGEANFLGGWHVGLHVYVCVCRLICVWDTLRLSGSSSGPHACKPAILVTPCTANADAMPRSRTGRWSGAQVWRALRGGVLQGQVFRDLFCQIRCAG